MKRFRFLSLLLFSALVHTSALRGQAPRPNAPQASFAAINQRIVFASAMPGATTAAQVQFAINTTVPPAHIIITGDMAGNPGDFSGIVIQSPQLALIDERGGQFIYALMQPGTSAYQAIATLSGQGLNLAGVIQLVDQTTPLQSAPVANHLFYSKQGTDLICTLNSNGVEVCGPSPGVTILDMHVGVDDVDRLNRCGGQVLLSSAGLLLLSTTLNGAITSAATSLTVNAATAFVNGDFLVIDPLTPSAELVRLQTGGENTPSTALTVLRGMLGPPAVAHANGATIGLPIGSICQAYGLTGNRSGTGPWYWPTNVEFLLGGLNLNISVAAGGNPLLVMGGNSSAIGIGSGPAPANYQTRIRTTTSDAIAGCVAGSGTNGCAKGTGTVATSDPTRQGVIIQNLSMTGPGGTSIGLIITDLTRSRLQGNYFDGWSTNQIQCGDTVNDGALGLQALYDNFYDNRMTVATGQVGYFFRRVCNAIRGFGNSLIGPGVGGGTAFVFGQNADSYFPNEHIWAGTTVESFQNGWDFEATQGSILVTGGRMETVANEVISNSNCKVRGVVFDSVTASTTNTSAYTGVCPGIKFRDIGQHQFNTGYGTSTSPGTNLIGNGGFEARVGTSAAAGWQSVDSTTWPSGTAFAVNTGTPQLRGASATLNSANGKCGGDGAATSGCFYKDFIPVDPKVPMTVAFSEASGTASQGFRVCARFFQAGAQITSGFAITVFAAGTYPAPAQEFTSDLGYNVASFALNVHCMEGNFASSSSINTFQDYYLSLRAPAGADAMQIAFLSNDTTHTIFIDDVAVSQGYAPGALDRFFGYQNTYFQGIGSLQNCKSTTAPAVCGSASMGSVAIAVSASSVVVNTSQVQNNSEIHVTFDASAGLSGGCNATFQQPWVSARVAGTSFTINVGTNFATTQGCIDYSIFNQ